MNYLESLDLDTQTRIELWRKLADLVEKYIMGVDQTRVAPKLDVQEIREFIESIDFDNPLDPLKALEFVNRGLWQYQVHTPHPRYFGLFNPASTTMSIVADTLVAAFNPQLAAWSHSPFAAEVERYVIQKLGQQFGYKLEEIDGTFTSGGAEANFTAILTALRHKFPKINSNGINGLKTKPVFYVSSESHHSVVRAARMSGLGDDALRIVPVDESLQMDLDILVKMIKEDESTGKTPFSIVATAGTTNAGVVDPISSIANIATQYGLWLHVDAAWGGAAMFLPELRSVLEGIERADSITFDTHKWLSVSMGAGLYLTRHEEVLGDTFRITTDYMPKDAKGLPVIDPYSHSVQWSRRFIGLKVFLSLTVAGWEGYIKTIRHQVAMGDFLRQELEKSAWQVVNKTKLPVVCFIDEISSAEKPDALIKGIADEVTRSGSAWISKTYLKGKLPVLRACITNYRTDEEDVLALINILEKARLDLRKYN
ncbi:MAG: pyridoxal phosphate-dependent decarboxylase family protein [Candidatus Thorarchaeota archaeon]